MLIRDLDTELEWYEVDESGELNALYLFVLLTYLKKCSLNQLAVAFYLFRFVNILYKLLNAKDAELFIKEIPDWEKGNLDSVLAPYIIGKFDHRFLSGLREIISKNIAVLEGDTVILQKKKFSVLLNEKYHRLFHKANFSCKLVRRIQYENLLNKINKIVGENQWQTHYISTE
ncbi:hypothetical protein ABH897_005156 [Paenibacillus sp. RC73]|uniref:hypothetical protein n=1 Tax=Paenibacillus sp. RC73 TaxID=3156250 RepID=UPI0038384EF1